MNDFILVHARDNFLNYKPALLRICDIRSVEISDEHTCIFMNKGSYYDVKETVEEIFKMIKENGK